MAKIVIKVDSILLVGKDGVRKDYIIELVSTVSKLINNNHKVALVASGATANSVLDENGDVIKEYGLKESKPILAKISKTSFGTGGID
ncbi:MAG: hypothetical protein ACP5JS_04690 [Fervidobacterium sp.]